MVRRRPGWDVVSGSAHVVLDLLHDRGEDGLGQLLQVGWVTADGADGDPTLTATPLAWPVWLGWGFGRHTDVRRGNHSLGGPLGHVVTVDNRA